MPSRCAGHVAADDHSFQQRVRIAFNLVAIHVGAGIAFVGIADDVLWLCLRFGQKLPLIAGQVARASAAPQLGGFDLFDDRFWMPIDKHLVQRLVSADSDVLLNVVRVDNSAIAQDDLLLALEERHFIPSWNFADNPLRIGHARSGDPILRSCNR